MKSSRVVTRRSHIFLNPSRHSINRKMSSTDFWAEPQDLVSIATETPQAKTLEFDDGFEACEKVTVTTKHGNMDVFIQGNRALKPIVTVHEIGLNYKSCFKGMLSHSKAEPFKKKFCFYHINLPGQGANDATLSSFPSMDGLAEMVKLSLRRSNANHSYNVRNKYGYEWMYNFLFLSFHIHLSKAVEFTR